MLDFGAEPSRPASLLSTLRTHQSPGEWQDSLPACSLALAGRDSHPLDFIKWFPLFHCWFLHFHAFPSANYQKLSWPPVVTENSVGSENTEVPIIRDVMLAARMSSLLVAIFALVGSRFRTRAALKVESLALRHQLAVFQKTRRIACASTAPTDCCGCC